MKKILLGLVLFFTAILTVNASTNKYNRETHPNLGVNKDIEITEYRKNIIKKTPYVNADEKVYDFADIFSESEEAKLYNEISNYIKQSKMDMVVLTTDLAYGDNEITDYAVNFYDYNDFGLDLEHYSGILLVVNMNSYNRFYNIYTFGNGIIYYNDMRLESMLDSMYNYAVNGYYYNMVSVFVKRSSDLYYEGIPSKNIGAYIDENGNIVYPFRFNYKLGLIIPSIVTLVFVLIFVRRNKMVKKATKAVEYMDGKSYICNLRDDRLIDSRTTSYVRSSSSSGGGSGFSSTSRGSSGRSFGGGRGRHF